jgi:rubrerythrin
MREDAMHILTVLTLLEQMELSVGRLYRHFAEALAHDREASAFFFRLYIDERQHASIVRYQRKVAWQNPQLISAAPVDIQEVQAVIARTEELVQREGSPTLEEALTVAAELETGAAELHYRIAVRTNLATFNKTVSSLGIADKGHVERLAEFSYLRGLCLYMKGAKPHREAISA